MTEDREFVSIDIPIDEELYNQVAAVCTENGTTPEEVAERFFCWCVENPAKAVAWLQAAMVKQTALEEKEG